MPKNPTTESTTFPYHKMELNARLYLAKSSAGPVLAIASLSGIKSNPAAYTDFARFNSYMDAFKNFFPSKVRPKEALTKLTLVSSRPFHGHTGRSFKLTIGDLSGSVHAFATKKRFYAIVSLNTKKDEALEEKFLSSFVLPERQIEQPKVTLPVTSPLTNRCSIPTSPMLRNRIRGISRSNRRPIQTSRRREQRTKPNPAQRTPVTLNSKTRDSKKRRPISGGMLNGKAFTCRCLKFRRRSKGCGDGRGCG